ncbi:MAG: PD-(D/E)XK nuclease family protein, partial [Proteobacteria bacterium]|nr:PD-(D/E)XK nuclease family protein [Pseudomonadota bacterium]
RFYRAIDWDLLAFFGCLFIVINMMEHALVLELIGDLLRPVLALGAEARAQIAEETLGVLDDPEFQALFGEDSLAEVSVVGEVNGHALAGQIDRLVVTGDTVLIVDYKTNRAPPGKVSATPEIYLRQMAAYRAVIAAIYPRHAVRCALLWTDGPSLMALDDGLLDAYAP